MTVHFECTQCGKCCHGLRIPLDLEEASAWLQRGHRVDLLCEAVPWPADPAPDDGAAWHKHARSFPAVSGDMALRVVLILTGAFEGACPNLQPDMRCGIYAVRPKICRIYPAEVHPFKTLDPTDKICPPEAWSPEQPVLINDQGAVSDELQNLIARSRAGDQVDTQNKSLLCAALGIHTSALANEGFIVHQPEPAVLLAALLALPSTAVGQTPAWTLVSNRTATLETLGSVGAKGMLAEHLGDQQGNYLGFFPAG